MDINAMNAEFSRVTIFFIAISAIATMVGIWVTYLVLKAAIRDGIKESGVVEALRYRPTPSRPRNPETDLPDMRAD